MCGGDRKGGDAAQAVARAGALGLPKSGLCKRLSEGSSHQGDRRPPKAHEVTGYCIFSVG